MLGLKEKGSYQSRVFLAFKCLLFAIEISKSSRKHLMNNYLFLNYHFGFVTQLNGVLGFWGFGVLLSKLNNVTICNVNRRS